LFPAVPKFKTFNILSVSTRYPFLGISIVIILKIESPGDISAIPPLVKSTCEEIMPLIRPYPIEFDVSGPVTLEPSETIKSFAGIRQTSSVSPSRG